MDQGREQLWAQWGLRGAGPERRQRGTLLVPVSMAEDQRLPPDAVPPSSVGATPAGAHMHPEEVWRSG